MYYRKAGIAQYTRNLVRALAFYLPGKGSGEGVGEGEVRVKVGTGEGSPGWSLSVLLDRRDEDTSWIPPGVPAIRVVTPAHHPYEPLALRLELATKGIGLLHSPDFITAEGRFKKAITVHDLYFLEHPEAMSADGARYYGRVGWSARRADRIIAVSNFTRAEILRLLPDVPADKIAVVHEAAMPSIPESPTLRSPESPFPKYALFVGTFEPRKNLATLLRALRHLPDDFRLVVVGEMGWVPSSEPARIAAELGVSERVHFAGRVDDAELDAWYRGARMLALPSLAEGFGLPAVDAMSRGTPVVCSNAGALPEVVGDAALLHDALDADGLSGLLRRMWIDDALRGEYAARGSRQAQRFSWSRAARETLAVYHSA